ncbi:MAG TPA: dipeptidase [Micromonosporaceae bacterium]|nr:dipeptidase [Micromonosporaceae bacterium]HCU51549.1 dipeptidase [Micromonosporaceae bacterium]
MILLSDPEILNTEVDECHEPLVDLRDLEALRLDGRLSDPDGLWARLRSGVVDRLVTTQTLLPPGLKLLIIEGYRPLSLQAKYFHAHVSRLHAIHPGKDDLWYYQRASRYISPPEVAPHVAGAAIDLTLCTLDGVELWMGTEVNESDTEDCHTDSPAISADATKNRQILCAAMTAAGLINYPTEWWHWSYGDRYWAHATGAKAARYGPVEKP